MSNQKPVLNISNCHLHWMHVGPGEGGWQVGLVMLRMHVTIQNLAKIRNPGCPCTHSGGMARKKLEFWHYGSSISYSHRMSQQKNCQVKTCQENALWLTGSFGHDSFISFISSFYIFLLCQYQLCHAILLFH